VKFALINLRKTAPHRLNLLNGDRIKNTQNFIHQIGVIEGLFDRDMRPRRVVYLRRRIQPHIMPKKCYLYR
jgi:hypothetical protein